MKTLGLFLVISSKQQPTFQNLNFQVGGGVLLLNGAPKHLLVCYKLAGAWVHSLRVEFLVCTHVNKSKPCTQ